TVQQPPNPDGKGLLLLIGHGGENCTRFPSMAIGENQIPEKIPVLTASCRQQFGRLHPQLRRLFQQQLFNLPVWQSIQPTFYGCKQLDDPLPGTEYPVGAGSQGLERLRRKAMGSQNG